MQKRQQRSLKRSTEEIQKMSRDKKEKKKHLEEKNCQEDLWQESYMGRQIKGIMRNIRQSQRGIGDIGKEAELEGKEQWRQLKRKKKKLTRKIQNLENRQKKMIIK